MKWMLRLRISVTAIAPSVGGFMVLPFASDERKVGTELFLNNLPPFFYQIFTRSSDGKYSSSLAAISKAS